MLRLTWNMGTILGSQLLIERWVLNASVGGWSPSYELRGPRYGELTFSIAICEGLMLVTLARIEKSPNELSGVSEGCDKHELHPALEKRMEQLRILDLARKEAESNIERMKLLRKYGHDKRPKKKRCKHSNGEHDKIICENKGSMKGRNDKQSIFYHDTNSMAFESKEAKTRRIQNKMGRALSNQEGLRQWHSRRHHSWTLVKSWEK